MNNHEKWLEKECSVSETIVKAVYCTLMYAQQRINLFDKLPLNERDSNFITTKVLPHMDEIFLIETSE